NDYVATFLSADGSLNGDAFHADIYDPAGPGSWEGNFHVYVRVTPRNSDYYAWFTRSTDGIADFRPPGGVKLSASVPPRTSVDIRRPYPPGQQGRAGQQGRRRKRDSDYLLQLREKQKVQWFYGVAAGQLARYFDASRRRPDATGEELLSQLEQRLDNVVYRLG